MSPKHSEPNAVLFFVGFADCCCSLFFLDDDDEKRKKDASRALPDVMFLECTDAIAFPQRALERCNLLTVSINLAEKANRAPPCPGRSDEVDKSEAFSPHRRPS